MKIWRIIFILLVAINLSACNKAIPSDSTTKENTNPSNDLADENVQLEGVKISKLNDASTETGSPQTFDLPEIGLQKLVVVQSILYGTTDNYYLITQNNNESKLHNTYLIKEAAEETWFYDLKTACYGEALYVCNIDADADAEIIIHQVMDQSGGAGQYLSRIFKQQEDNLCELYNSSTTTPLSDSAQVFDTGFRSEFLDEYKLVVTNKYADCSVVIDISNRYISEIFDANGKCTENVSIWCDSFFEFKPIDLDADGVFEIECAQYASLFSHTDGIGCAKSILKFDLDNQIFRVVRAEFISKGQE